MTSPRHLLLRAAGGLALALGLAGCDTSPQPIRYTQDACAECKMTLVDRHYGAELVTAKGKVFKFDDLACLRTFRLRVAAGRDPATRAYVIDFDRPATFLSAEQAVFLHHDQLRTPMGGGLAAFADETGLAAARAQLSGGGRVLRWPAVLANP